MSAALSAIDLWSVAAEAARGRWAEILPALGVTGALRRQHGPCPAPHCGGADRFRFSDKEGRGEWFCGQGGAVTGGDGFGLLGHVHGWDKARQLEEVCRYLGISGQALSSEERAAYARRRQEAERRAHQALRDGALLAELEILRCEVLRRAAQEREALPRDTRRHEASARLFELAPGVGESPYLVRKGVGAHGVRFQGEVVLVPMRDVAGRLHGVQRILPDGQKRFPEGLSWQGLLHLLGEVPGPSDVVGVAEGYATAASVHEAMRYPVACAFVAGNLERVARTLRWRWPRAELVIWADWDGAPDGKEGVRRARGAAEAVGGLVLVPPELTGREKWDWNDIAAELGGEGLRHAAKGLLAEAWQVRAERVALAGKRLRSWLGRGGKSG